MRRASSDVRLVTLQNLRKSRTNNLDLLELSGAVFCQINYMPDSQFSPLMLSSQYALPQLLDVFFEGHLSFKTKNNVSLKATIRISLLYPDNHSIKTFHHKTSVILLKVTWSFFQQEQFRTLLSFILNMNFSSKDCLFQFTSILQCGDKQ